MLPGTSYNDSWLLAMEALRRNHGEARGMRPNFRRYRFLQIAHAYKKCYLDRASRPSDLTPLWKRMSMVEKTLYGISFPIAFAALRLAPIGWRTSLIAHLRRLIGQHAMKDEPARSARFANLVEVFESMDTRQVLSSMTPSRIPSTGN
jgi:hypothetical protein